MVIEHRDDLIFLSHDKGWRVLRLSDFGCEIVEDVSIDDNTSSTNEIALRR